LENLLLRSRFELKYLIGEPTAHEVRQFARNHLMPDPFADASRGYSYTIYSVYLDNAGLSLMNQTLEGLKNRFKLRVRFYDNNPDHPVFFEVKRRVNDAIIKSRAKVRRDAAHRLMHARACWPDRSDLANPADDRSFSALCKFCELRDKLNAKPAALVAYNREAWCAPEDDSVRVTFDRVLEGAPYDKDRTFQLLRTKDWVRPPLPFVVLELKFTDRFPNWMRQMVQTFNLFRTSMAKYVTCQVAMEPDMLAMIREDEALRRMAAARRWEQERRREHERLAVQAAPASADRAHEPLPPETGDAEGEAVPVGAAAQDASGEGASMQGAPAQATGWAGARPVAT
jgi:hypothetical protein